MRQAAAALRAHPPGYVVNLTRCDYRRWPLFRALAATKTPYVVLANNALPPVPTPPAPLRVRSFGQILTALSMRVPLRWLGIRPAASVLAGGSASVEGCARLYRRLVVPSTELVFTHAHDYDRVLEAGLTPDTTGPAVFLDEFMPFHPDWAHLGMAPPIGADEYYGALRSLFTELEGRHGLRVVIAAHPRASYREPWFGPREVHFGQTCELVRQAPLVIAHMSTALSYAVLYRKPVLFATQDRLAAHYPTGPAIERMAEVLGGRPLNLDRLPAQWELPVVDEAAYARYREQYIKRPGTPDLPLWAIFADYLVRAGIPTTS